MTQIPLSQIPTKALELFQAKRLNERLMSEAGSMLATTAGLGGAAAGGVGLYNLLRRNLNRPKSPGESLIFSVPTQKVPEEEGFKAAEIELTVEQCDMFHRQLKRALGQEKSAATDWDARLKAMQIRRGEIPDDEKSAEDKSAFNPVQWGREFMSGVGANTLDSHPLAGAAQMTAGIGGLYGGYRLVDALMDKRRKQELDRELGDAQEQYELALQQLIRPSSPKMAEEIETKSANLYDMTKAAGIGGGLANALLTFWPPLALGSGVMAYNMAKSRRQSKLLEKAIRSRQRKQLDRSPMYAFPDYRPAFQPAPVGEAPLNEEEAQALAPAA